MIRQLILWENSWHGLKRTTYGYNLKKCKELITSAEREVKDSRGAGMFASEGPEVAWNYNRIGLQARGHAPSKLASGEKVNTFVTQKKKSNGICMEGYPEKYHFLLFLHIHN